MKENPESGIQQIFAVGIRNPETGIRNPPLWYGIRNPEGWNPESRCWDLESRGWDPESRTFVDFLTWGETSQRKLEIRGVNLIDLLIDLDV